MCEIFGALHKVKIIILCLSFFSDNGTVCTSPYPIFGQVGHGPPFFFLQDLFALVVKIKRSFLLLDR